MSAPDSIPAGWRDEVLASFTPAALRVDCPNGHAVAGQPCTSSGAVCRGRVSGAVFGSALPDVVAEAVARLAVLAEAARAIGRGATPPAWVPSPEDAALAAEVVSVWIAAQAACPPYR